MSGVFISYRRNDAAAHVDRLYETLCARLGTDRVFMDIDTIRPGEDFVEVLSRVASSFDVVLIVIGREWLSATDARGARRLDDPRDFVRLEVEAALGSQALVIPLLVDGATMPSEAELPESLAPLARRQALELTRRHWRESVDGLIIQIQRALARQSDPPPKLNFGRRWTVPAAGTLLLLAVMAGFKLGPFGPAQGSPESTATPGSILSTQASLSVRLTQAALTATTSPAGGATALSTAPLLQAVQTTGSLFGVNTTPGSASNRLVATLIAPSPGVAVNPSVTTAARSTAVRLLFDAFDGPGSILEPLSPASSWSMGIENGEYVMRKVHPDARGAGVAMLPAVSGATSLTVDARLSLPPGTTAPPRSTALALGCRASAERNDGGYFLFVWPASGTVSIEKLEAGNRRILIQREHPESVLPRSGAYRALNLTCAGASISAHLGDVQLLAITDTTHTEGRPWISVGSESDEPESLEARFDNLSVVRP